MNRKTPHNSSYKKLAIQRLNEALCFVSSSVAADSFVLRNRQLLVAANRWLQLQVTLRIMKFKLTILFVVTALLSCKTHTRWTEKQKKEFAEKCSKTDTADGLNFYITGFSYDEIENILVRQIHNGQIADSFFVRPNKNSFDKIRTTCSAYIDKPFYIRDTLQFIIPGQDTFFLSEMKMIMWSQFTMYEENYGCVMGDYKINGVRFEHDANPVFIKKGFKY